MISSWNLVIKDMKKRNKFGIKKYGVPVTKHTPVDMLQEHYEELLDACVYIRTEIEKRKLNASK